MDVKGAERAIIFKQIIGFPSSKGLLNIMNNSRKKIFLISWRNIQLVHNMFGPKSNILKSENVQCQPGQV